MPGPGPTWGGPGPRPRPDLGGSRPDFMQLPLKRATQHEVRRAAGGHLELQLPHMWAGSAPGAPGGPEWGPSGRTGRGRQCRVGKSHLPNSRVPLAKGGAVVRKWLLPHLPHLPRRFPGRFSAHFRPNLASKSLLEREREREKLERDKRKRKRDMRERREREEREREERQR